MTKHTPIPWIKCNRCESSFNEFYIRIIEDENGNHEHCPCCGKEGYLIYSVNMHDELVEALKYIAGHAGACLEQNELGKKQGLKNCISKAMDTLSKAKGE